GGAGNDELHGGTENDTLAGDAGNDGLWGDEGEDTLDGGSGIDVLLGGDGNDQIDGGADQNFLFGDDGEDVLNGGAGDNRTDHLWGGNGDDLFVFSANNGSDWVEDFTSGADKLDVSALGFSDFQDLLASTSDSGGTATISYGSGDSITLIGVATGDLVADDFIF
ncbi:MAG: calcium-binding protein, partial [Alphaproteobacteria bacterium]